MRCILLKKAPEKGKHDTRLTRQAAAGEYNDDRVSIYSWDACEKEITTSEC
jgi:hypothetical protein